tara:strand:+ start:130 stop:1707 length:1578 start_codon:yes stop_codon:yes gene_type:complete
MGVSYGPKPIITDGLVLCLDVANVKSFDPDATGPSFNAQKEYTTSGTHTFEVPVGVTSISALCVGGGGGGGGAGTAYADAGAGGGGGLSYGTMAVTPGEYLTVVVGSGGNGGAWYADGANGGNSQLKRSSTVLLQGGGGSKGTRSYSYTYGDGGDGGTSTGTERDGGGEGGNGGNGGGGGGGGGGAAGYSGNGGNGRSYPGAGSGTDGSGGGGGGAGANGYSSGYIYWSRTSGGGVGIYGEGSNGTGGSAYNDGNPGSGGSSANYGGGGGGAYRNYQNNTTYSTGGTGAGGAVRIVYSIPIGSRQYPTLTDVTNTTYIGKSVDWNALGNSNKIVTLGPDDIGPTYKTSNPKRFDFNGTNDYATFNPGSDIAFGTGQFAVEIWAKFSGAGPWYFIDTRNASQTTSRWALYMHNTERLWWFTGSGSLFNDAAMPTWSTGDNGWNQIVFSREGTGSNEFKAYINGEYKMSETDTTDYSNSSTEASIGRRYNNAEFMNGSISMLKIYKGRAMSAAEVKQNYDTFKERFV